MRTRGSDLLVAALENEGVRRIFGLPGEENLAVVESLRTSRIDLVLTRHEQAASFMAATQGRLTGSPGICLSTLGPGALNFTTGAAYAYLGAMPMVMITGQKAIKSARQARFQLVDIVGAMRPITKMTRQIISADAIPSVVRDAFRVATEERPGPVHLELPEDIAAEDCTASLIAPHPILRPIASPTAIKGAVHLILAAKRPLIMIGAAGNRPRLVEALSDFVRRTQIPFLNTQMGKGAVTGNSELYLGTAALSERDYIHEAIEHADLIIAIGHDTIEKPPFLMGSSGGPKVVYVGYVSATVEQVFHPDAEVIGDIGTTVTALADALHQRVNAAAEFTKLRDEIRAHINERAEDDRFPVIPQRLVHDVRKVMPEDGIVCLDNGMYKIWFASQLPDDRRQYATVGQRARHHGRRPALGHCRQMPQSAPARARGVRRWRFHDEQPGAGNRRSPEARSGRVGDRGFRLRHDPLEAGRRQVRRFRHDVRQSGFRALCGVLWRPRASDCGDVRIDPDAGGGLPARRRASRHRAH
jgi:acetolactate synthase-1/2/3 large subunit